MSIATEIRSWNETYTNVISHIQNFNNKMAKKGLGDEEIDKIHEVVKHEVDRLRELSNQLKQKEEELSRPRYFGSTTAQEVRNKTILNGIVRAAEEGATALALAARHEKSEVEYVGWGILAIALICDGGLYYYENMGKSNLENAVQLARLNTQGIEHATLFEEFLRELKEIKKIEKELMEEYRNSKQSPLKDRKIEKKPEIEKKPVEELDKSISKCLQTYDTLPIDYKREDVYCKIISYFIQRLPPDDPLSMSLSLLGPKEVPQGISHGSGESLPVEYLPTFHLRRSSSSGEGVEPSGKWKQEGAPERVLERSSSTDVQKVLSQRTFNESPREDQTGGEIATIEYQRQVAFFSAYVTQRWGLRRPIPHFETPEGWRISFDGIKKVEEVREENIPEMKNEEEPLLPHYGADKSDKQSEDFFDIEAGMPIKNYEDF